MDRRFNWQLWSGFTLSIVAFASYFAFFIRFPATRDVPLPTLILFAIAIVLLVVGLRSARRHRPLAWIVSIFGIAVAAFFCFAVFIGSRQIPVSATAAAVGAKAPDFVLLDINRKPVALAQLLAAPSNKGVVLIFYRGSGDRSATPSYGVSNSISSTFAPPASSRLRSASTRPSSRAICATKPATPSRCSLIRTRQRSPDTASSTKTASDAATTSPALPSFSWTARAPSAGAISPAIFECAQGRSRSSKLRES
jgi:hypothetical protein